MIISSRVIHKHIIVQTFPKHLMFVGINPKPFSKEGSSFLVHNFSCLHKAFSLESSLTGTTFKILDARQSEILTVLSRKSFSASAESTRFVCKIIKSL